ncbi:MAG: DNA-directed RNA polymerase [Geoglossum umbratile]|nr:MAG: DNA-directed RNA polymerase [Geoglossum umbratile]
MLVRAAKRRIQRDAFRHFNIPSEQLYLPWLCPAQMRFSSTRATSVGSRSRKIELNRETSVHGRRNLATAAVAEHCPLSGEYVPFENLPPAYAVESSHANWPSPRDLSSLRPLDLSSTIVINKSVAVERRYNVRNGSGGDLAEIHLTLDACLRVERLERAATLVRRLAAIYDAESKELLDSHNQYIRASVGHAIKTRSNETYKSVQKWFEVEMRSKGVRPDATTYALLVKGALLFLRGPKIERTVRRYMELATDAGDEVKLEVLSLPILSDSDIYRITEMCPTEFPKDDECVLETPESALQPGFSSSAEFDQPVPEVKPAQLKGLGLIALKKSLSIFGDSRVPYPNDIEGTEEDRDRAYSLARQRRLEEDAVNAAVERWREEDENLRKMGLNTSFKTRALGALMWSWYSAMVPLIKTELEKVEEAEAGCSKGQADQERCLYGPFLRIAPPEKLAAVTILGCLSTLSAHDADRGVKMMNVLRHVGHLAEEESMAEIIKDESNSDIWGNIRISERREKLDSLMKKKHTLFRSLARLVGNKQKDIPDGGVRGHQPWNTAIKVRVGGLLVSLLVGAAKMPVVREHPETGEKVSQNQPAFFHTYQYQQGKKVGVLMANSSLVEKLRSEPVAGALAKHLPMVVAPKKWASFNDGGFLVNPSRVMRIKGSYGEQQEYAMAATEKGDLDQVFAGLDVLSKTPWRINRAVFDVMLDVWNSGEAIANIPPSDPKLDCPPEPDSDNPEERRRWIRAVRDAENVRSGLHSQRCFLNFQLEIARAFLKEKFYFPHNLDFRGRAYPIPPYLNHMGADNCRGLLMFAEGKELGVTGLTWLKVHVANVFGYDKASFKEREEFCTEHLVDIYDSAINPLNGKRWWLKAEDPWQCLAACIELKNALDSPQPTRFKSHLAIHQDGTCNGLQHYAALGGDMWGARQVNLEPGERPSDIYTAVANLVAKEVSADAVGGNALAKHLDGKITRKVVKQTVMTNVYGVTFSGARTQVRRQLEDTVPLASGLSYSSLSAYIARKIFKALASSFNGAHNIQYWLGECAKRISQSLTPEQLERLETERSGGKIPSNLRREPESRRRNSGLDHAQFKSAVVWTTPLKIPVVQPYRTSKSRVVTTSLQRVSITEPRVSDPVSRRKQSQAFPPNFIHSLDATHMLLSAIRCNEAGLTFASVHDSFWTHACDVNTMNHILRDAFVQIHSEDVIARLAAEFRVRYKGCMYLAQVPSQSAVGKKIKIIRKQNAKALGKGTGGYRYNINELLLEYKRLQLLESDDPMEQEEGRKMVTPGSVFSETADNREIPMPVEVARTTLSSIVDQATAEASRKLETEMDQSSGMGTIEPVENRSNALELMVAGLDVEVDTGADQDEEVEGGEEEVAKGPKRSLHVWVPLAFPPVPKRGEFDVSRLKESKYFFS